MEQWTLNMLGLDWSQRGRKISWKPARLASRWARRAGRDDLRWAGQRQNGYGLKSQGKIFHFYSKHNGEIHRILIFTEWHYLINWCKLNSYSGCSVVMQWKQEKGALLIDQVREDVELTKVGKMQVEKLKSDLWYIFMVKPTGFADGFRCERDKGKSWFLRFFNLSNCWNDGVIWMRETRALRKYCIRNHEFYFAPKKTLNLTRESHSSTCHCSY